MSVQVRAQAALPPVSGAQKARGTTSVWKRVKRKIYVLCLESNPGYLYLNLITVLIELICKLAMSRGHFRCQDFDGSCEVKQDLGKMT
jgi:hypothetical protein